MNKRNLPSLNSGHLDWRVRKIGIFQSVFVPCDVNMMLRKQVRTFLTFKLSHLKILPEYGSIFLGVTKVVGGWPSSEGTVTLRLHRNPQGNLLERRATLMLTIEGLLAVLSFGLTCFSIGYAMGRNDNHKTQK